MPSSGSTSLRWTAELILLAAPLARARRADHQTLWSGGWGTLAVLIVARLNPPAAIRISPADSRPICATLRNRGQRCESSTQAQLARKTANPSRYPDPVLNAGSAGAQPHVSSAHQSDAPAARNRATAGQFHNAEVGAGVRARPFCNGCEFGRTSPKMPMDISRTPLIGTGTSSTIDEFSIKSVPGLRLYSSTSCAFSKQ